MQLFIHTGILCKSHSRSARKFASLTSYRLGLNIFIYAQSGQACYLWRKGLMMATTAVTSGVSSAQTTVTLSNTSTGFETTGTNDALANIGFIASICIFHRCAIYRDKSITRLSIMQNYNITEIPAGAFFGATNVEVCQNINYRYSQLQ